jgi:two-component system, chemotaxis family, chemotaxis protein CheY
MSVDLSMPVLVVEDSRTMGRIVRNLLMLIGFRRVDHVVDGATALSKLRENNYGLVISDWNMQPVTGQVLLESIRADPALSGIPFIMVTAESNLAHVTAAKNAGANGYIVKPFSGETLKAKIAAISVSGAEHAIYIG